VSARGRVVLVVVAAVLLAAVLAALAVVASDGGSATRAGLPEPRPGRPPLSLALGLRTDPEARALERAAALYARGRSGAAASLFARYDSLEAKVGAAFARWPEGTYDRLEQLAKLYPESALVQLHLGLARLWANRGDPVGAWRAAIEAEPDTPYAIVAGNLLHPHLPRGLPTFVPSFQAPSELARLAPADQLEALRRRAARGGVRELLLYGVGLQRVGRPLSAARVYERAARAAPRNAEAQVAAAVGLFTKDAPETAFSRLGPLARRFPREPTVRFHLGLLLLWTGRIEAAERQLERAARTAPDSPLAHEAARYLETIRRARR
jgi:tetratricopeptide (TPR) repeat protein